VVGEGPIDLVLIPGLFTHVEHRGDEPSFARFLTRLASFSRLIVFDARGAGLSDQAPELPPIEEQMDDLLAVLDAVGSSSAAIFGLSQAGPMAMLFAASYPERSGIEFEDRGEAPLKGVPGLWRLFAVAAI
jgi:pimeloyl-ACP methyl ester carboxylesterase